MKSVILLTAFLVIVTGRKGIGPNEQEWGYVTVRKNAHMFWWLHQTTANVSSYIERPLIIWLQGGPGASSTGLGNFDELGPLDTDLTPRNTTWIKEYNVLFVDNPVGTGFSYVESEDAYVKTNKQIADDFLVFLQGFYKTVPELKKTPLFIFGESYGGKMTVEIALVVHKAIERGELDIHLNGIGLGDAWISSIDYVSTWGPYLLNNGAIDQSDFEEIQAFAAATKFAFDIGNYKDSSLLWGETQNVIERLTSDIDFYNILTKVPGKLLRKNRFFIPSQNESLVDQKIEKIMNNHVKKILGLNVSWDQQSSNVFSALFEDFMKPVTKIVELLLDTTNIQVAVYNGQLDLIVDTPGTIKWIDSLQFVKLNQWRAAHRKAIVVDGIVEGYYKKSSNLAMYWVNRAGHMVPTDNPAAMQFILQDVIDKKHNKNSYK